MLSKTNQSKIYRRPLQVFPQCQAPCRHLLSKIDYVTSSDMPVNVILRHSADRCEAQERCKMKRLKGTSIVARSSLGLQDACRMLAGRLQAAGFLVTLSSKPTRMDQRSHSACQRSKPHFARKALATLDNGMRYRLARQGLQYLHNLTNR